LYKGEFEVTHPGIGIKVAVDVQVIIGRFDVPGIFSIYFDAYIQYFFLVVIGFPKGDGRAEGVTDKGLFYQLVYRYLFLFAIVLILIGFFAAIEFYVIILFLLGL
jgi:hypothetical protein